jgi:hypothetical protein
MTAAKIQVFQQQTRRGRHAMPADHAPDACESLRDSATRVVRHSSSSATATIIVLKEVAQSWSPGIRLVWQCTPMPVTRGAGLHQKI